MANMLKTISNTSLNYNDCSSEEEIHNNVVYPQGYD